MKKFEYRVIDASEDNKQEELNRLGVDGWELISVLKITPYDGPVLRYIFKRETVSANALENDILAELSKSMPKPEVTKVSRQELGTLVNSVIRMK